MQTLLQGLTEYWPIMGALSPEMRRELLHELVPLVPIILSLATALIFAGVTILLKLGTAAYFSAFLITLVPFLMHFENRRSHLSTASIKYGKLKVRWQSVALGCLVLGGLLAMVSVGIWVKA